ncbi:hypothetical protein K3495_g13395 [Podosphaera aphanis]|nr:hypothetical protein K3495_g13395 [Podosphaera aphanis]
MKSQNITRKPFHPNRSQKPNSSPPVDERLFLRLEQDATERLISPYPLLLQLRKFLGENAALLKEVQHVPSGLALRPSSDTASPRLESLFSEGIKGRLRGALGIEKAQNLVTYLLSSIPRSYTALNDADELINFPITAENVCSKLKEEKGLTPVAAFETRTSLDSPHSYTARYIVRFPLDTILPQKFQLFGVEVISRRLSKKASIIQYGRCFQWHNERICSRALRCRLCGSTEHVEENHSPCGPHPHPCPARCIHCHGPHAADATECPLRPRRNGNRLTKEQVAHIRQSSAAARMSLCTTVGCTRRSSRTPPVDHEMPDATSMPNFGSANTSSQTSACTDVVPSGSSQLTVIPATYYPVHTGNPYSPLDENNEL